MPSYYIGGLKASSDDIFHYGVKGMKWGVRRYQNPDGSYTSAGKKQYKTYAQLKKDYPELDYEPDLSNVKYGDDKAYDEAYAKYEASPRYDVSVDSYSKLQKKISDEIGDWYNSSWKRGSLKRIQEAREKELNAILNNSDYKKYLKQLSELEQEYDNKYYYSLPKFNRFQKKLEEKAKREAGIKSFKELLKDPRYKEAQNKCGEAYKSYYQRVSETRAKYDKKMLGQILKELGYQNTAEARAYIYYATIWD